MWDVINCTCCTRITQDFVPRHKMMTRGNDAITRQECLMRPDWSPDGEYLTTSFGVTDTSCFVSPIYKRGTWQRHGRAVGHSMPTTVAVKFCLYFHVIWIFLMFFDVCEPFQTSRDHFMMFC